MMANSLEIDLTEVFEENMAKFNKRDRYRFEKRMGKHMIKIIVAGFKGRMGSTATNGLRNCRL